jgi:transcriptional regulator with XRE-family HTH domain
LNDHLFNDEGFMAAGDTPTVARRRVRLALREAREAAGMTQTDVAEAMEWSLSKVIQIESGEVSIAPNDLRPLLGHLGIKDRARVEQLHVDAKTARTRQRQSWWQAPLYREYLSALLLRLIEFEGDAVAIRFGLYVIPGPLLEVLRLSRKESTTIRMFPSTCCTSARTGTTTTRSCTARTASGMRSSKVDRWLRATARDMKSCGTPRSIRRTQAPSLRSVGHL